MTCLEYPSCCQWTTTFQNRKQIPTSQLKDVHKQVLAIFFIQTWSGTLRFHRVPCRCRLSCCRGWALCSAEYVGFARWETLVWPCTFLPLDVTVESMFERGEGTLTEEAGSIEINAPFPPSHRFPVKFPGVCYPTPARGNNTPIWSDLESICISIQKDII